MVYSYFLTGYDKKDLSIQTLDCCERMHNSVNRTYLYELIKLDEVHPDLRNKEKISKYIEAISKFLDVKIYYEDISEVTKKTYEKEEYWNEEKFLTFRFDVSDISAKRELAAHNLIRYLWYANHQHMVNIVLKLYESDYNLNIEDIFAIAHSFQISNNRALTGNVQNTKEGLVYFPDKITYISDLQKNYNFNITYSCIISDNQSIRKDLSEKKIIMYQDGDRVDEILYDKRLLSYNNQPYFYIDAHVPRD